MHQHLHYDIIRKRLTIVLCILHKQFCTTFKLEQLSALLSMSMLKKQIKTFECYSYFFICLLKKIISPGACTIKLFAAAIKSVL
jgi:hypothetical protein